MIIKLIEAKSLKIAKIPPYVDGIATLTVEGFKKLPKSVVKYDKAWWLPQKENNLESVPCVLTDGTLSSAEASEKFVVRPLLLIDLSISTYGIGDKFMFGGKEFIIVPNTNGGTYGFCLEDIGSTVFDVIGTRFRRRGDTTSTSGDLWGSDYDKFITTWFNKNKEKRDDYNAQYMPERQELPTNAKFKLTHEIKLIDGAKCYRILATKSFGNVKAGDKGGYVDFYDAIPSDASDTSWVYDGAAVIKGAKISKNSKVRDNAIVSGVNTEVKNDSDIFENAKITAGVIDHSKVLGNALICASVPAERSIPDNVKEQAHDSVVGSGTPRLLAAQVMKNAVVCGLSVLNHALIGGNATVIDSNVGDNTTIYGSACTANVRIGSSCEISGNTTIVNTKVPDNSVLKDEHWDMKGAPTDRPQYSIVAYDLHDSLKRLVEKGEEIKVDVWSKPDRYLKFSDKETAENLKDAADIAKKFLDSNLYVEVRDETSGQKRQFIPGPGGAKLVTRFRTTPDFTEG